jgi:hypothetical protein
MTQQEDQAAVREPLEELEPVELVEVDEPSACPPPAHGEWVDADPDDPDLDHTGCAEKHLGADGDAGEGVA